MTVGIPVRDVAAARAWYDQLFERRPNIEPVPNIAEYEVGGMWVQLMGGEPPGTGWVLRVGVRGLEAERARLAGLGVEVGAVQTVPGVVKYFDFRDPDGNALSWYEVLDSPVG